MTNTSPVLSGQANLAGSDTALYLKMFGEEIFKTFRRKNKFLALTRTKDVGAGRSHQFPAIGQADAAYHVRGEDLWDPANGYLNLIEGGERTIQVDKTLLAATAVDNWDELIKHFSTRETYAEELGEALAYKMDRQVAQVLCLAARASATLSATQSSTKAGEQIVQAGVDTSASLMIDAIIDGAVALTEKNVPMEEIHWFVRPAMYYELQKQGDLINKDFNPENGSQAMGMISRAYGFNVHHSNHIPSGVVAADAGELNTYSGDFSNTAAIGFHGSAVGTVYRQGIVSETEKSVSRQAELLVSKMVAGTGILRPECAIEVVTA